MSNLDGDFGRPLGLRHRASSQSDLRHQSTVREEELQEISLESMDPTNPGREASSNDTTRFGSQKQTPKPDELPSRPPPRWKRNCRKLGRPFAHSFNFVKHKLQEPGDDKVGWKRTMFILLAEQAGLALGLAPYVYSQLGYLGGTTCCIAVALLGCFTNMTLFRFKRSEGTITSICDVAQVVGGGVTKVITLLMLSICSILIAAAHIREGGDFFTVATSPRVRDGSHRAYRYICPEIAGTVLMAILILAVALPRNFHVLSVVSMASVPLTVAGVASALGILWPDDDYTPILKPWGYDYYVPVFGGAVLKTRALLCIIFSFLIHPTSPAVMSDMKNVNHFPRALIISTVIQVLLFIIVGHIGYTIDSVYQFKGTVFDALRASDRNTLVYGMVQPSVILQAGLFVNVLGREFWRACLLNRFPSFAGGPRFSKFWWTRQGWWVLLLLTQVLIAWLFAGSIANLGSLLGLVASIPGAYFFFALPTTVAIYVLSRRVHGILPYSDQVVVTRSGEVSFIVAQCLIGALGVTILILGTWASLWSFVGRSGDTAQGLLNPFACAREEKEGYLVYKPDDLYESGT